jgi:predicted DNA-binding transcriptional regulator YafY
VRTIERDLDGVPIWGAGGRKGGYGLDRNLTLPPLSLTAEEALAIIVALRSATGWARRVLKLVYVDAQGGELARGRAAEPVVGPAGWYLVAWCRLRRGRLTWTPFRPSGGPHPVILLVSPTNSNRTVSRTGPRGSGHDCGTF